MATDFNSKYSGEQVEALLDQVASGNAGGGGGGGITVETDPIFSNSPAATITDEKIAEWDAKSEQGEKGDKGDPGVGVQSVAQTTTSSADGGSNVVTVTLTDGTKSTFTVKNGSKGSQGVQGIQGEQGPKGDTGATGAQGSKGDKGDTGANGTNGKDGTDGATFTPSVDSAGNLSWTNNKGLANPPTVNIKGPKGDAGSGEVAQKEIIQAPDGVIEELEPNKVYILRANFATVSAEIQSIVYPEEYYGEYSVIISAVDESGENRPISLTLPSYVMWPNGVVPDMSQPGYYELSITYWATETADGFNAVLTRFNFAE